VAHHLLLLTRLHWLHRLHKHLLLLLLLIRLHHLLLLVWLHHLLLLVWCLRLLPADWLLVHLDWLFRDSTHWLNRHELVLLAGVQISNWLVHHLDVIQQF